MSRRGISPRLALGGRALSVSSQTDRGMFSVLAINLVSERHHAVSRAGT
jgi:hypothetical protein